MFLEKIVKVESFRRIFRLRQNLRRCLTILRNEFFRQNPEHKYA
jgi:hypothetical protein